MKLKQRFWHPLSPAQSIASPFATPTSVVYRTVKSVLWLLFIMFAFLLASQTVLAHGGGELQVANAPIATYQVSVWTNPPRAQANQPIHVTVGIATAVSGEPVLDAAVDVRVLDARGESVSMAAATTEQSINRLFYEADLDGVATGSYEVVVQVVGSEGRGDVVFPLEVSPRSVWPWVGGGLVAGGVLWVVLRWWQTDSKAKVSRTRTAVPRRRPVD